MAGYGRLRSQSVKSGAAGDSQHKSQNGYLVTEGTSDTSLVPRRQIICNSSMTFSLRAVVPNPWATAHVWASDSVLMGREMLSELWIFEPAASSSNCCALIGESPARRLLKWCKVI
ncbi:hypothetical protein AVEN_39770-1 [Araneus ventricosus]|uniref:Uncharacterized protein n=1 Tax=Araneus ventricosus TaxID=182803 RepID=A0A4Y2GGH9_ARAVE|nr:hypothetical protein AVEN_39770-1 [Araneus ventricosus]